jgi:AcrR family transcriptional regulator
VRAVLSATRAQLGEKGLAELRVEEVAAAAGVNKTSVYRRWPTKAALVHAALMMLVTHDRELPDRGDVRAELLEILREKAAGAWTPRGRNLLRAVLAFQDEQVSAAAPALRAHRFAGPRRVLERAIERGELPADIDVALMSELLVAPIFHRILDLNEPADEAFLTRLVDHVLAGSTRTSPRSPPRST